MAVYENALTNKTIIDNFQASTLTSLNKNAVSPIMSFINAANITNNTQISSIIYIVNKLLDYNLYNKMLAIWPMVGGTADSHKLNLNNPANTDSAYRLGFTGSWSHTSNGAIPNGINAFADTFIQPSNSELGQNDICISYYVRNATNDGSLFSVLEGGNNGIKFELRTSTQGGAFQCLNNNESATGDGSATKTGLLLMSRIASNEYKRYGRGVLDFTYTATSNTRLTGYNINMGCKYQIPSSRSEYTAAGCSFASIGKGLNATEVANLNTIVQQYQTLLNRQV